MSIKATIIGAQLPELGGRPSPTRLGSLDTGGVAAVPSAIRPAVLQPTAIPTAPAAKPAAAILASHPTVIQPRAVPGANQLQRETSGSVRPTVLPYRTAPAEVGNTPAVSITPSALPGIQRKPLDVALSALAQRFPGVEPRLLERTQAILAGLSPDSMPATAWLNFGVHAQEDMAALVKQRLDLMQSPSARGVAQHLARLHALLGDVLHALAGGFLRKPAGKVWESVVGEVRQLETLLSHASPALAMVLETLAQLEQRNQVAGAALQANAMAAEYLADVLRPEVGQMLVNRLMSLTTAQALAVEQHQMLELESTTVKELLTLVQDGVLLQLPSVYSQLAGLSNKPSDTQRFLATEKLAEIAQSIQRKL